MMTLLDSPFGLFAFWCLVNGAFAVVTLYSKKQEAGAGTECGVNAWFD